LTSNERTQEGVKKAQPPSAREVFEGGSLYPAEIVCRIENRESSEYVDRLLIDKFETIRRHLQPGLLVDLCCATGEHLAALKPSNGVAIGIDFSVPYLIEAEFRRKSMGDESIHYFAGDARALPLATGSVDTLYSLSALYVVPELDRVLGEIVRVLRIGGRCILDLGNRQSINSFCIRNYYTELPPSYHLSVPEMLELCRYNSLQLVEHRAFQILPLWAGRPRWLWPLLHPVWKRILGTRVAGRMVDEWLCCMPIFRRLAFRHLLVCEKC